MPYDCSGVILAGGLNRRFDGREKGFLEIGGRSIMDRLHEVLTSLFDDVLVVTNAPSRYLAWDWRIVSDVYPVRSSLTGLHSGLFYARHPRTFFVACDAPFLRAPLVRQLVAALDDGCDVAVPHTAAGWEPLCAVYSQRCRRPIERLLQQGEYRIRRLFDALCVRSLTADELCGADPGLHSFFNINTPADLARARRIARETEESS